MLTENSSPCSDIAAWTRTLTRMARQPLEFCPDFPRITQRMEAWWAHEAIDRPVILCTANKNPARPMTRRLELLHDPYAWFDAKFADMTQTHYVGEALPNIRVDFGPVLLGNLVGGKTEIGSDTTWTHASIDDTWSNAPSWKLLETHTWWALLKKLLAMVADDARGRYVVCTPDLGGSGDVLLNLRGAEPLCMDVLHQPQRITEAVQALFASWQRAFKELYRQTVEQHAGVIHWLGLWSNQPYMIPACDFSALISPKDFQRLFLPDVARQAGSVGRAIFHLDGPDAARHINALLEIPEIQAIQFTPGEGTPSVLPWMDMFKTIQAKGRSVLAITPIHEVVTLCRSLRPEGMAVLCNDCAPEELDHVFTQISQG